MLLGMSGPSKDRFDVGMRALKGGKQAGPREMQRIREREVRPRVHFLFHRGAALLGQAELPLPRMHNHRRRPGR